MLTKEKQKLRLQALEWALCALGVLAVSLSLALARVETCDYVSVNGDFQSYNVFRRILAGQTPYVDFANYVGMAPVVLNLPLVALNNSFANSLFVTNFTAALLFSATVLLVFWLVARSRPAALLAAVFFVKFCSSGLMGTLLGARLGGYLTGLFESLYTPSNSMRIARLFLPFLLAGAALVWLKARRCGLEGDALQQALARRVPCLVWGLAAGLGVSWSNDFGLACLFCLTVLFVLVQALRLWAGWRVFAARLGIYLAGALGGAAVSACLASGGHPLGYLRFTRDVGGWQYFYFNGTGGRAMLLYLLETPRLWAFALPAAAFLAWCLTRLWQKRLTDRQLVLGFLAFAILAATGAYTVSGSGYNFKEALEGYTWLALFALAARGLVRLTRRAARLRDGALRLAAAGLALALAVLAVRDAAGWKNAEHKGEYIPALGGWCEYTRALVDAPALTGGAPVFSAYATGLETVEGTFQPTGCDYIIHALGEERRAAYLAEFERGAYPYAQTPRLELENWLTAQNWDFYRELWAGYERVSDTEYSWLWRRCGDRALPIRAQAAVEQLDGGMVQITVSAPGSETFTADLEIVYDTAFTGGWGAFVSLGRRLVSFGTPVFGDMPGVGANLPAAGRAYLPVRVENGSGTVTLWAQDNAYVRLTVQSAEVVRALPAMDLYERSGEGKGL